MVSQVLASERKHVGKSGRVYESDHPLTRQERRQIDEYDAKVEMPKRAAEKKSTLTNFFRNEQKEPPRKNAKPLDPLLQKEATKQLEGPRRRMQRPKVEPWTAEVGKEIADKSQKAIGEFIKPATDFLTGLGADIMPMGRVPGVKERMQGMSNQFASGFLNTPVNVTMNTANLWSELGEGDWEGAARSAGNVAVDVVPVKIPGFLKSIFKFGDNVADDFTKALGEAGQDVSGVPRRHLQHLKQADPKAAPVPKTPVGEVVEPTTKSAGTGLARQFEDPERVARGLDPTKKKAQFAEDLAEKGRKMVEADSDLPNKLIERSIRTRTSLEPDEVAAVAFHKRNVANEARRIEAKMREGGDPEALAKLNEEYARVESALDEISEVAQHTRTKWHDLGESLQVAYEPDLSLATLKARAKAMNLGQDVSPEIVKQLDEISAKYYGAIDELDKVREELRGVYSKMASERGVSSTGVYKSPDVARARSLAALRKLGVKTIDVGDAKPLETVGRRTKRQGAAQIPLEQNERVSRIIRTIAKSYITDGSAHTLDDVVQFLKRDIPGLSDSQALSYLSLTFKNKQLEANVARLAADKSMREVKAAAAYRLKPVAEKAALGVFDTLNFFQRSVKAGFDLSAPFIQGRAGLGARPGSWIKSWGSMAKALTAKDSDGFIAKMTAEMESDPMFARSVQAKLQMTTPGGGYTRAEEMFAGNLIRQARKVPVLGIPFKALARTENAYTAFLNKLRFDWFKKAAALGPDDPEYLRDLARTINIATGRGDGKVAELAGHPLASQAIFAPRYTVSQWQMNLLKPLYSATTNAGRMEAAKMYAGNAVVLGSIATLANWFGWELNTDPRDSDFGRLTRDDGVQYDLFNKAAQPTKLMAQILWGKVSKTGNYTEPGNDAIHGSYIKNKLAPLPSSVLRLADPTTYDEETGEKRPMNTGEILGQAFLPMSIGEAKRNARTPVDVAAAVAGMGVDKSLKGKKKPRKKAPPLEIVPPGLKGS